MTDTQSGGTQTGIPQVEAVGFFAADHAAAHDGKLYVNGGYWNTLRFTEFPAILPSASIVAVIQVPFHASHADHPFEIELESSDGNPQGMKASGMFRAAPSIETKFGDAGLVQLPVPINGLPFESPGDYSFVLRVNGRPLARYPIHVVQVFNQPTLIPPPPPKDE